MQSKLLAFNSKTFNNNNEPIYLYLTAKIVEYYFKRL